MFTLSQEDSPELLKQFCCILYNHHHRKKQLLISVIHNCHLFSCRNTCNFRMVRRNLFLVPLKVEQTGKDVYNLVKKLNAFHFNSLEQEQVIFLSAKRQS